MRNKILPSILIIAGLFLSGCGITEYVGLTKVDTPDLSEEEKKFEDKKLQGTLQGSWYYDHLTSKEKVLYNKLYKSIKNWDEEIALDGEDSATVKKVFNVLHSERPELFYLSQQYEYKYYNNDQTKIYNLTPHYLMGETQYKMQMREVDEVADQLVEEVKSKGMGEFEAELYIHDYLVNTVDYYTEPHDKEDTPKLDDFRTIYGTLINHKANCMGYARTMTYIMNRIGIQCTTVMGTAVSGNGETGLHEWNLINIKDNWYHLDVCWDDPSYEKDKKQDNQVRHSYFNVTTKEILKTRTVDENLKEIGKIPDCNAEKDNYYVANGYLMTSADAFQEYINKNFMKMVRDNLVIEVRFTNNSDYSKAIRSIGQILEEGARKNNYYEKYTFKGYPNERGNILICELK